MNPGRVAVIIVNYNAGDYLEQCLQALNRQTLIPNRIVLVDNDSTDGSADSIEARHPRVDVIRPGRNLGFAAGNNLAVEQVDDCDWVALLNPDAFPDPEWLAQLMSATGQYPECVFFGSRLLSHENRERLDGTGDVYHASGLAWRRDHARSAVPGREGDEIFSPCAAAALYRRDVFLEAGGFDERYFCYFEDVDLGFRLRLQGHRGRYVPESVVEHVGGGTTGKGSAFSIYHGHRNLVWTWIKNMPDGLRCRFLAQFLLANLLTVFWFILKGQGRAILKAKFDALKGMGVMLRDRRRLQKEKRVGENELLAQMATAWGEPYRNALGRKKT